VNLVCALLLASLRGDAGVGPDASLPLWAPRLKRTDLEDAAYGLYKLGEGYIWQNSKFEARIGRDGVVTFKDIPILAQLIEDLGDSEAIRPAVDGEFFPSCNDIGKQAVLHVLRNPIPAGLMPCHDEVHEGQHQAIIDQVTLRAAGQNSGGVQSREPAAR
jgi:hypothetical protein